MKIGKRYALFALLMVLCFFTGLINAGGQEFSPRALEYYKRSLQCMIIGDYDNAIINCNVVLRYNPDSADTYVIRGRAYYEKGDMENAIADSTKALSMDRTNVTARMIRGNAYAVSGRIDRAITDWQAVLRVEPENTEARANIDLARQRQES